MRSFQYVLIFLSKVRVLVKEVEEARGGVVSTDYQVPPMLSSNTVSSSSQVISEHLVSFKYVFYVIIKQLYVLLFITVDHAVMLIAQIPATSVISLCHSVLFECLFEVETACMVYKSINDLALDCLSQILRKTRHEVGTI